MGEAHIAARDADPHVRATRAIAAFLKLPAKLEEGVSVEEVRKHLADGHRLDATDTFIRDHFRRAGLVKRRGLSQVMRWFRPRPAVIDLATEEKS